MKETDVHLRFQYAGFWKRVVADIIDSVVLNGVSLLVALMILGCFYWVGIFFGKAGGAARSLFDDFSAFYIQILLGSLRIVSSLIYYTWGTYRFGTTLGKRCFHIYVVNVSDGSKITLEQSFIRYVGYALSAIPLYAGYLMVALESKKRGLHDLLAGTVSIIQTQSEAPQKE